MTKQVAWTPFNLPRSQILMQIKNKMELRRPLPMRSSPASRDQSRYCDFHQDHGHITEECNSLKSELEGLARKGLLNEYISNRDQLKFVREQGRPQSSRDANNRLGVGYQQAPPPLPPPSRIIHMITGGLEAGGTSSKQQKLYVREVKHPNPAQKRKFDEADWKNQPITFSSADFDGVITPHNDPLVTSVIVNNCEVQRILVDTRSAPDIMYYHCFESLGLDPALLQKYDGPIYGFNNQPVPVEGILKLNVAFGSGRAYVTPSIRFLVVKMASSFNIVIGRPTLTEIRAVVSPSHLCLKFPTLTDKQVPNPEPTQPEVPPTQQVMGVELLDNRPDDEARATPAEEVEEVQLDSNDPTKKTKIGTKLSSKDRAELIDFLKSNRDVFAWTSADMPGIPTSIAVHKLSTHPSKKPVAQKRRLFGGKRLETIKAEVQKLLQAGFVRRVDYCEWVANPVLVKKSNGQWRMCVDYTNLNDACPKDCHPLSSIDRLVESASGNERLSLLDAYSRYHQVHMAPEDEVKTSFYAGNEIYCYVMMPFGLKNTGATYQKMVTIVFRAQIGRNLEVYVDDIVVKSLKAEDHLTDLAETFNNLRTHRMRLNPAKCVFGVESGKFLGFMVSRRGIEVNPEKIKAIEEMKPPKSIKDVQRLAGRIGALHRFVSKSAEKCLPFFKILRSVAHKDETGKLKKFEWTSECQTAFNDLKSYLSSPPLLTKAMKGEILYLYLGISDAAVSSVLIREADKQQKPVYYASRVLQGAELRYSTAEKAALTVVTTARKLRPYFQAHPIVVLTDQPLRQILQKPECSGRLIKWAVVLGEFQITFQQRSYSLPLLRCLTPYEAEYALREVHEGVCGSHVGARALAHKVLRQGYYWPHMQEDAKKHVQKCPKCQFFAHLTHQPAEELTTLVAPWPFAQWGIDLLGPFVKGTGGVTHLVVAVDYFTKWVEAQPLSSLTSRKIEDFVFSSVICRYGIPNQVVADNGPQFNCTSFKDFCSSYGIKLVFTSVYHPEANGMVESVNKAILEGIKPRLDQVKAKWADELNNVLWAYRTTSRTATVREEARLRTLAYKQKLANSYNRRVRPRTFRVGDLVLRKAGLTGFETRFRKLAPNWEGPYVVTEIPHPGAYVLVDAEGKRIPRVWNVNNLKKFYP
ncbi:hypothetical protein SLEP1_g23482 [Rubroshorea leprosula]|uniref:Integrase catalytic domain-containing protein n=1 Tax=Rubroshorea leprosula TaxID=152421 RepID=A0AAV5JCJ3_9ROSI|nr:hypothetical protein SLEP1_g23482 [Rubroshorea leprosula]